MKIKTNRLGDVDAGRSKFRSAKHMSTEEKESIARGAAKRRENAAQREVPNKPSQEDEEKLRSRTKGRTAYNMLHSPHVSRMVGRMAEVILATNEPLVLETDEGTVIVTLASAQQDTGADNGRR